MKEVTFETKVEGFVGTVTVKVPTFRERLVMLKDLGISLNQDEKNQLDVKEMLKEPQKILAMLDKVMMMLVKCDLKFGDKSVTDPADLEYYEETLPVIMEALTFLVQGLSLGKH